MSYRITNARKGAWRVMFKAADVRERTVPKSEWGPLGFISSMTREEAKRLASELNKSDRGSRLEAKRNKIHARMAIEDAIDCSRLPILAVRHFETEILLNKLCNQNEERLKKNKLMEHWRTCKKIIRKIESSPQNWEDDKQYFFNEFANMAASRSYVCKLLRLLNEWSKYLGRRAKTFWPPIPHPNQAQWREIENAHEDRGRSNESDPLTPAQLETHKSELKVPEYNWLFVSIWFGLRPWEIDLRRFAPHRDEQRGLDAIKIFQPKVRKWKLIPLIYPEQRLAFAMLTEGNLRRPSLLKLHKIFGMKTGAYAGRKGFHDLMSLRGHNDLVISDWLGHQDLRTTRRSYRNKDRVSV